MLPTREKESTLVDLIDRLLDKGLVLNADLVITMGDVPLIGINLRAMVAGMETMIQYGLMQDFEEKEEEIKKVAPSPLEEA